MKKQLTIRFDEKDIKVLQKLTKVESENTGFNITVSDLIRKAVKELIIKNEDKK